MPQLNCSDGAQFQQGRRETLNPSIPSIHRGGFVVLDLSRTKAQPELSQSAAITGEEMNVHGSEDEMDNEKHGEDGEEMDVEAEEAFEGLPELSMTELAFSNDPSVREANLLNLQVSRCKFLHLRKMLVPARFSFDG
jgi:hypothetical protein